MGAVLKSKKKVIFNVAVVLIVTLFAIYYLNKSDVITEQALKAVKWWNYLVVLACFFLCLTLLSFVDYIVYRSFTKSMPFGMCLVNTLSGNLGSGVTPLKSGHFPLMAYYQFNSGVPINDTVVGLVKCQIIYSATSIVLYSIIVGVLAIGGYSIVFYGTSVKLWSVVSLGLLFHVVVFVVIVILAFNLPIQKKILLLTSKIIKKFKRGFNEDNFICQKTEKLKLFKEQLSIIGKNFKIYILPIVLYAVFMFLSGSVQYLSYLLISGGSFSFSLLFAFYTLNLASAYITNVIPVPGGVGTSEVIFTLTFASVIPNTLIGSVLILWRMATYYVCIIIELVVFSVFLLLTRRAKKSN